MTEPPERLPPTRLARRLGTTDAVVIGLGSMLGAGVFAAFGPAAAAAGSGLLVGLALAAAVAYCNATSSAQLAAVHPEAGGTYVYGRQRLGAFWGHLAGWAFVVGKTASCAAMALTFGAYAAPRWQRELAVAAVVATTAVNYRGIRKTAWVTRLLLAAVLASLAAAVVATLGGGTASITNFEDVFGGDVLGVFRAGGILFFAFAGYARIATLGEEVIDPARTIPRAIPLALGIATAIYAVVAVSALAAVGPGGLAASDAPLATAARAGSLDWLSPAVRVGGTVAALGVLLSLLAGVSRTAFAMAADGELPRRLAAVHPRHRVPHRAELAVGALIVAVVATADLRGAIGFSSFAVLVYYAVANAAAWTLPAELRRWPRLLAGAGFAGCLALAFTLPATSVAAGMGVLGLGVALRALRRRGSQGAR
ncbi:MAG: amino acid permease [Actinobacteria bacterium]|nr:amino acid permease [Actinomycetota bacterium]